jgi:hypothetical protein
MYRITLTDGKVFFCEKLEQTPYLTRFFDWSVAIAKYVKDDDGCPIRKAFRTKSKTDYLQINNSLIEEIKFFAEHYIPLEEA